MTVDCCNKWPLYCRRGWLLQYIAPSQQMTVAWPCQWWWRRNIRRIVPVETRRVICFESSTKRLYARWRDSLALGLPALPLKTTEAGLALVLPPRKKAIGVGDQVLTKKRMALTFPLEREGIWVESLILTREGPALKFPPRRKENEIGVLVLTRAERKILRKENEIGVLVLTRAEGKILRRNYNELPRG